MNENIENSLHAVRKNGKWYVGGSSAGGGVKITEVASPAEIPPDAKDGEMFIVPKQGGGNVPSEENVRVIDMSKYAYDDGTSFLGAMVSLLESGGGSYSYSDNSSFWADLDTDKQLYFLFDGSTLQEGITVTAPLLNIMKEQNKAMAVVFSFVLPFYDAFTQITAIFYRSFGSDDGQYWFTHISMVMEPLVDLNI